MQSLFPYDKIRPEQDEMVNDVKDIVSSGGRLIAHAPTGLGKTAAVLAPALGVALEKGYTIFFLTSRHTQHAIAIETLKIIKEKYSLSFSAVDFVGKKHMCAREEVNAFPGRQFHEYCKSLRNDDNCEFYLNFRKGSDLTPSSKNVIKFINSLPAHTEETVSISKQQRVCPYEVAAAAAKDASVIIADYYNLFNPKVRESFFKRSGKSLDKAIIIVDEAHNLPGRMRELLTNRLSTILLSRALKESEKWGESSIKDFLNDLNSLLGVLAMEGPERVISKDALLSPLSSYNLTNVLEKMYQAAEYIREADKQSFIGSVADFLARWQDEESEFSRVISAKDARSGRVITVSHACLDPSPETAEVLNQAKSVILMSGTLTPLTMYRDILGFPKETLLKEYKSPLPKENRLALIVKGSTTKFSERNASQYMKMAKICADSANTVPGNVAIFFPSYYLMEQVHVYLHEQLQKEVFKEHQDMSKEEKNQLLKDFRRNFLKGGVLLAVIGGNFSEGIDLPGQFLNGVIIVGLPLVQPDIFTKELISYYEKRYKKGWDYGYVFPAFTKALQSAGRCIRTETDRGVILFVDDRYAWPSYYNCFPKDMAPKTTVFYQQAIADFFSQKS